MTKRHLLIGVRKSFGSQDKVAKELEISRPYLSAMENGHRYPNSKVMIRMSRYFGISERKLFPDLFSDTEKDESHSIKS